jgi:site-specific DNA-methyltransferase (adenine-specific)
MDDFELINGECIRTMRDLPDGCVDLVLCDPPYGTTGCKWDSVIPFAPMWRELRRVCRGGVVLFAAQPFTSALVMSNVKGFSHEFIWDKGRGAGFFNAKRAPLACHESALVFGSPAYHPQMRTGFKPYRCVQGGIGKAYGKQKLPVVTESNGDRYPLSIVQFGRDRDRVHPTQKPVALMRYLVRTYTTKRQRVLDFTMGSGTTGVACKLEGRRFVGIEMDADYFKIASERIASTERPIA